MKSEIRNPKSKIENRKSRIKNLPVLLALASCALAAAPPSPPGPGSIAHTPHNLSVTGPGPIKSPTETQICIFCHTPHTAVPQTPLWNRDVQAARTYIMPTSPTLHAYAGRGVQPDGASKLCLSCHDGTIALGSVRSRPAGIPVAGALRPGQRGYLGTDLSGSHPISFVYSDALALRNNAAGDMPLRLPSTLNDPKVKLDKQGKMQCTTCHDPHDDTNYASSGVHFFAKPDWSELCLTCHDF
ncbi:MAG: cytochrome c3 family protein [Planctomycetes bacterium]|nr:cytochrome c3 family protein [Planctomycetota bacterium]